MAVKTAPSPIRVQAIRLGYYGIERRRPGAVFFIQSEIEFSGRWMRKLKLGETPGPVDENEPVVMTQASGSASGQSVI